MKETGLMFKAPLVRAILEGRKTQTRLVLSDRTLQLLEYGSIAGECHELPTSGAIHPNDVDYYNSFCRYGKPGDRIYVRETFVQGYKADPSTGLIRQWDEDGNDVPMTTWYRATDSEIGWQDDDGWETNPPWRPSNNMPKELTRIWLEITGVRVERLQEMSQGDAVRDGGLHQLPATGRYVINKGDQYLGLATHNPVELFQEIWDSNTSRPVLPANKNSKRYARVKHWLDTHPDTTNWAANPWVWVIDFKTISTTGRPA